MSYWWRKISGCKYSCDAPTDTLLNILSRWDSQHHRRKIDSDNFFSIIWRHPSKMLGATIFEAKVFARKNFCLERIAPTCPFSMVGAIPRASPCQDKWRVPNVIVNKTSVFLILCERHQMKITLPNKTIGDAKKPVFQKTGLKVFVNNE